MTVLYTEKAEQTWWVLPLFRLFTVGMVLLFAWMALYRLAGWQALMIASFLMAWAMLAFQEMRYELTEEGVVSWFWPFKTTVRYADIEKVEVVKAPWWVGIGCHWWKGTWWYLSRTGNCVRVTTRAGKGIAMTPKDPERLAALVRKRSKGAQKAKKG